ncbi:MAG: flagellar motor switch protein FliN [Calditrichaeota bacterium]|nr:flagellar motor switch protein FliN [Calditrichota bacterium]MCB9368814.1 flagellar motor switch protein FliN [Calditrichota bacterium]
MSEVFHNAVTEDSRVKAERHFSEQFRKSLGSFIERQLEVVLDGPFAFDFKEVKAYLPGEVVMCTISTVDMSLGKTHFFMTKEAAATIADLVNMGEGNAEFIPEEHLETIRDLFKETVSGYFGDVAKAGGPHQLAEEAKAVLIDMSPADFVGSWTVSVLSLGPNPNVTIVKVTSNELIDALFPPRTEPKKSAKGEQGADVIDPSVKKEMSLVMDIELPISIELGRTHMLIRDIVKLSPGSVVELDKLSGEPVDLYVNNKRFARGEVVVIEENFAVRITDLINPEERFASSKN